MCESIGSHCEADGMSKQLGTIDKVEIQLTHVDGIFKSSAKMICILVALLMSLHVE